jgi:hypothetical protein
MARYKIAALGLVATIVSIPVVSVAHVLITKPLSPTERKALLSSVDHYVNCLDAAAKKFDDGRSDDHLLATTIARQCVKQYRELAKRTTAQVILKPGPALALPSSNHDPYAGMKPDGHIGIASNLTQAIDALRISRCARKYGKSTSASGDCFAILDGRPGDAQDKSHGWP